jgi:hypothetical protein
MWKRVIITAACCGLSLALGGCVQPLQDMIDRAALRALFGLPVGAELVEYQGFPSTVGFGQREGLRLRAVYDLSHAEAAAFLKQARDGGWQPLPISAGLVRHIPFREIPAPLDHTHGLFVCRTAGDQVLYPASTQGCLEVQRLNDLIFGVFDSAERRVWISVQAGY